MMGLGNQSAGIYGNLGTGLANLYNQLGQAGYGTNVGIGNAQAAGDLANYNASGNLWGLGLGLLGAGTGAAGQAGGLGKLGGGLMNLFTKGFARGGRPDTGVPAIVPLCPQLTRKKVDPGQIAARPCDICDKS